MKTFFSMLFAGIILVLAVNKANAQTFHGYVVVPDQHFWVDCDGVTNELAGTIEKHFWWHIGTDGFPVWDKSNVKCDNLVSLTTGEIFKVRYQFSETQISGITVGYSLNYTFVGKNGTVMLVKQNWEFIDGVETLIKENSKCL